MELETNEYGTDFSTSTNDCGFFVGCSFHNPFEPIPARAFEIPQIPSVAGLLHWLAALRATWLLDDDGLLTQSRLLYLAIRSRTSLKYASRSSFARFVSSSGSGAFAFASVNARADTLVAS
jgi:hypothetical protein